MFQHDHIAIAVSDFSRSADFYRSIGGRIVSKPSSRFLEIVVGDVRLHFIPAAEKAYHPSRSPRIDHLCLRVASLGQLQELRDIINKSEAAKLFGLSQIQESPPLGPGESQCEERPPLATLYFRDPDGIGLEARCYGR